MGPLAIVSNELLAGIGDMGAQGGEEIESRTGNSAWRMRAGAAVIILRDVGDLGGFEVIEE